MSQLFYFSLYSFINNFKINFKIQKLKFKKKNYLKVKKLKKKNEIIFNSFLKK